MPPSGGVPLLLSGRYVALPRRMFGYRLQLFDGFEALGYRLGSVSPFFVAWRVCFFRLLLVDFWLFLIRGAWLWAHMRGTVCQLIVSHQQVPLRLVCLFTCAAIGQLIVGSQTGH